MKKAMISFSDPQFEYLETEAARLGMCIPELVRRILDEHLERRNRPDLLTLLCAYDSRNSSTYPDALGRLRDQVEAMIVSNLHELQLSQRTQEVEQGRSRKTDEAECSRRMRKHEEHEE